MRIPITRGFSLIPEGTHVFKIESVDYDADFGLLKINMCTASGQKHTERFQLKDANDEPNEKALLAWSFFAQSAMNDYEMDDLEPEDMVGHYIRAEVTHTTSPSRKDPNKTSTFVRLGQKEPASGFDNAPAAEAGSVDLDSLLD